MRMGVSMVRVSAVTYLPSNHVSPLGQHQNVSPLGRCQNVSPEGGASGLFLVGNS